MGVYYMQVLKEETKKMIHQGALMEFYEKGYKEASMRGIADRGGMTVGNLYRYFKNKEDLFCTVISPAYCKIIELTEERFHELENSKAAHKFIEYIVDRLLAINRAHRLELLILIEGSEGTRFEDGLEEIICLLENKFLHDIFPKLKKNPSVDEDDAYFGRILSVSIIEGMKYILKHCEDEGKMGRLIQRFIHFNFNDILERI